MMGAGNTIKGEITIVRAPSARNGRSKLQAVCAGGEVIVVTRLRKEAKVSFSCLIKELERYP